jgi:hypothetical protein
LYLGARFYTNGKYYANGILLFKTLFFANWLQ